MHLAGMFGYQECYPKTISAVELNHNTTNATARLTVEIQYSWWTHENKMKTDKLEINKSQSPASSLGELIGSKRGI